MRSNKKQQISEGDNPLLSSYHSPLQRKVGYSSSPFIVNDQNRRNASSNSSNLTQRVQFSEKTLQIQFTCARVEFTIIMNIDFAASFILQIRTKSQIYQFNSAIQRIVNGSIKFNEKQVLVINEGSKLSVELMTSGKGQNMKLLGKGALDFMTYQAFQFEKLPLYDQDKQLIGFLNFQLEIIQDYPKYSNNNLFESAQKRRQQTDNSYLQDAKLGSNLFSQAFQQQKSLNKSALQVESEDSITNSKDNSYFQLHNENDQVKRGLEIFSKNLDNYEDQLRRILEKENVENIKLKKQYSILQSEYDDGQKVLQTFLNEEMILEEKILSNQMSSLKKVQMHYCNVYWNLTRKKQKLNRQFALFSRSNKQANQFQFMDPITIRCDLNPLTSNRKRKFDWYPQRIFKKE